MMKKTTKKLGLNKETLRTLSSELTRVRGGEDGLTTVIKDLAPFTSRCPRSAFCPTAD
jgi:hypothetical protein